MFQLVELIALVIGLTLAGFGAGWARIRWRAAPAAASALVVGAYAIVVIKTGIWAASCPGCRVTTHDRTDTLWWSAASYGALALLTLFAVWVGVATTARIRWRVVPLLASAVVAALYAIAMIAATIWAASCPKCNSGELHRIDAVAWSAIIYGGLALVIVLAIWIGAAFTRVLTRMFGHGPSA
jgi:hypothetical protein